MASHHLSVCPMHTMRCDGPGSIRCTVYNDIHTGQYRVLGATVWFFQRAHVLIRSTSSHHTEYSSRSLVHEGPWNSIHTCLPNSVTFVPWRTVTNTVNKPQHNMINAHPVHLPETTFALSQVRIINHINQCFAYSPSLRSATARNTIYPIIRLKKASGHKKRGADRARTISGPI